MKTNRLQLRFKKTAIASVFSLFISSSILTNSAVAENVTSGTATVSFSIVGGPMGDPCLANDYSLSVTPGADSPDPSAGSLWTSEDLAINQVSGNSCPGDTLITATSLGVEASYFVFGEDGYGSTILCDGIDATGVSYGGSGTAGSCPASTNKVNISLLVPESATPGTVYQSTVTVTAIIS